MTTYTQFAKKARASAGAGFSLIELLIVVAIILIIAAIAIPNLLRARMAANEAAAAETLRTITTASVTYNSTWGNGFPPSLAAIGGVPSAVPTCDAAGLVDPTITAAPNQKSGFTFGYSPVGASVTPPAGCTVAGANAYIVTATPIIEGVTGIRSFCGDEPGAIHFDTTGNTAGSSNACDALPQLQ
jgi:prepilin-type N-terminal cleavage/methylation domain-containing protein